MTAPGRSPSDIPQNIDTLQIGSSEFAVQLFQDIAADEDVIRGNVLISLFSAWGILVTASLGVRGETAEQLASALNVEGVSIPD